MKKFLLIVMAVAMTGSFTSCVENEVPAEIEAIYNNQADLLAAEAALLEAQAMEAAANAAFTAAQAAYQEAMADLVAAQAAAQEIANQMAQAENAIELERLAAELEAMRAQYAADIAAAELQAEQDRIAAERAQLEWEQAQANLQAAIAAAAEARVQAAYAEYLAAVTQVNALTQQEINDRLAVLQQMDVINDGNIDDAAALAALEDAVAAEEAKIAAYEAQIAGLEAMLEPGTTVGDYNILLEGYQARLAEIEDIFDAWSIDKKLADDALAAATADVTAANGVVTSTGANAIMAAYNALQQLHKDVLFGDGVNYQGLENLRNQITTAEGAITAQEGVIANLQDIVDNYDTKLADLNQAVTDATAALAAAVADEAAKAAAETAAENTLTAEQGKLTTLQTAVANANANLDQASNDLTAAKAAADLVDIPQLELDVANAEAAVATAQAAYDDAEARYNNDPTGEFYPNNGADGELGIKSDNAGSTWMKVELDLNTNSFSFVGEKYASLAAAEAFEDAALAADANYVNNGYVQPLSANENTTDYYIGAPAWDDIDDQGSAMYDVNIDGFYFDIENDDPAAISNLLGLQTAADDLDNAKATLAQEQTDLANGQAALDYSAEQEAYDEAENIFNNAVALLEAQQAVVQAAVTAEAQAEAAHAASQTALTAAQGALTSAQGALAAFNNKTETQYQDELQEAIADLEYLIDNLEALEAELAADTALSDDLAAQIDAGPVVNAEQQAALDAQAAALAVQADAQAAVNALLAIQAPLLAEQTQLNALVTIVEGILNVGAAGDNSRAAIQATIDGIVGQWETAMAALATAQDNLAKFTDGSAAREAELERREATHAATVALLEAWQARAQRRLDILNSLL